MEVAHRLISSHLCWGPWGFMVAYWTWVGQPFWIRMWLRKEDRSSGQAHENVLATLGIFLSCSSMLIEIIAACPSCRAVCRAKGLFASSQIFSGISCEVHTLSSTVGTEKTRLVLPFRPAAVSLMQLWHRFSLPFKMLWLWIMIYFNCGINTRMKNLKFEVL